MNNVDGHFLKFSSNAVHLEKEASKPIMAISFAFHCLISVILLKKTHFDAGLRKARVSLIALCFEADGQQNKRICKFDMAFDFF